MCVGLGYLLHFLNRLEYRSADSQFAGTAEWLSDRDGSDEKITGRQIIERRVWMDVSDFRCQ